MPSSTIWHEDTLSPDEAALIQEFVGFLKDASARRYPSGTMKRFNQGRQTAFLQADFIVPEGLPDAHRVGIFAAPRTYAAWIRFANAAPRPIANATSAGWRSSWRTSRART